MNGLCNAHDLGRKCLPDGPHSVSHHHSQRPDWHPFALAKQKLKISSDVGVTRAPSSMRCVHSKHFSESSPLMVVHPRCNSNAFHGGNIFVEGLGKYGAFPDDLARLAGRTLARSVPWRDAGVAPFLRTSGHAAVSRDAGNQLSTPTSPFVAACIFARALSEGATPLHQPETMP